MVQDLLKKCAQSIFCYVRDLGYHPLSEIIRMYPVYHEMDITKFSDRLDEIFKEKYPFTRLRYKRDNINYGDQMIRTLITV